MKLQYTDEDGEVNYVSVAEGTALGGEWIQLANESFEIPQNASDMYIYVETADGNSDFSIDEMVAAVDGTVIEGAGKAKNYVSGDINNDGLFTILDITLAKHGLLYGFNDNTAEVLADIDRNGKFDIEDIKYMKQYLFGIINENNF